MKITNYKLQITNGQSLFEIVIATLIVSIVMIALVNLATVSIANTTFSKNKNSAARYTQQAVEWLRGQRDEDWNAFYAHTGTSDWCLSSLTWGSGGTHTGTCATGDYIQGTTIFRRNIHFIRSGGALPNSVTIQVNVSTEWQDRSGLHTVATSNIFTNWKSR